MRKAKAPVLALFGSLLALALFAAPAQAALEVEKFETSSTSSLAGAHPDLHTSIVLKNSGDPEVPKNISFDLPRGMFGNPKVLSTCEALDLALLQCPSNSQVGLITIRANYEGDPNHLMGTAPIYGVQPGPEDAAKFAFIVPILEIPVALPVGVRSATDYGLRFTVSGITQLTPLVAADLTFWGFPADNSHTPDRFPKGSPGNPAGCPGAPDASCNPLPTKASVPVRPFTGNSSICGIPMESVLSLETYQRPGQRIEARSSYPSVTDCERQTFAPVAQARLTTKATDSPSGMEFEFGIPQAQSKAASPSALRAVTLLFPEELTINPDAADGQSACSDVQAGLGLEGPAHCPDNAKVGTVKIKSESLPGDLEGSIYFGEPVAGNQYRLFLIAEGFGINAKLIGKLLPDPRTGQLTVEFQDLPQLPLERFELNLFASDRGVFATPTRCAVYTVTTRLFPWNSSVPDQRGLFGLGLQEGPDGGECPGVIRPFEPRLNAGTSNSKAGSFSNFTLKLDRNDGDQFLGDLNFTMPPGLTASLRGVKYCPEGAIAAAAARAGRAEQASPSCPGSSDIGSTNVAAGPGSHPFHAAGQIYMAGPFKGAPLSLVAVTPALAGPYDYGVVVVRVAVGIDSTDAHVIAVSDTVPSIIGGIPLRLRSIQVNLDKPNFMINPTNCKPMAVGSQGIGNQGSVTNFSSYFQAIDCSPLAFKPRMSMVQKGGGTARSKNPSIEFQLRTRPGDANIESLAVTLSKAFAIDQRHLGNLCSEAELARSKCAGRQPIGTAFVRTPLLDDPLSGAAYAVSGKGGLPRLAFVLDGQVSLIPRAKSAATKSAALKTTVPTIPDAPIGEFRLTLLGGKKGYLINTRGLCTQPVVSTVEYSAQNGKKLTQKVRLKSRCGGKAKSGKPSGS
jgi:hypothetical protein